MLEPMSASLSRRYEIHEKMGEGNMAEVYRATHLLLKREVALKILKHDLSDQTQDERSNKLFIEEARAVARLNHPNILQVYDFDVTEDGRFFMATEYLPQGNLLTRLKRYFMFEKTFSLADTFLIIKSVAQGLGHAHGHGIIHRDVKLSNIFLAKDERVVIGDFGLAKSLDSQHEATLTGGFAGTPTYMSPEQILGQPVDQRTDVYALGVVFFQLLTGQPPYASNNLTELLANHLHAPIPDLAAKRPDLPPQVVTIVQKCLAKQPNDRFQTMHALIASLDSVNFTLFGDEPTLFLNSHPSFKAPPTLIFSSLLAIPRPLPRAHLWAASILLLVLVALGAAYGISTSKDADEKTLVEVTIPPAAEGEYLIVVAPLYDEQTQVPLSELIVGQLEASELSLALAGRLRVETVEVPVASEEQAQAIGQQTDATLVIWGRNTTSSFELTMVAPRHPSQTIQSLQLASLRDNDFASQMVEAIPQLVDYYARFLVLQQLIQESDLYSALYLTFTFKNFDENLLALTATPIESYLMESIYLVANGQSLEADTLASNILEIYPQDISVYMWRWAANLLGGQGELAERDALRLGELTQHNDFAKGLATVTYFVYANEEKVVETGSQFESPSNSATVFAMQEYYQVLLHQGRFHETLDYIMAIQDANNVITGPVPFVNTLIFVREIQGDREEVTALVPDFLETRKNRFAQEGSRFFQQIQPRFYHPVAFSQGGYGSEQMGQPVLAQLSYQTGLGYHPDDYLLNWRQAGLDTANGVYQLAYERYETAVANAPVPFPVARYDQALLVAAHGDEIENHTPVCDLLADAKSLAESDPDFYMVLLGEIEVQFNELCN